MGRNLTQKSDNTRYKVIPRVLIFIFNDKGQVLLIEGSKTKVNWPELFNGLGGHIEAHESSLEAAKRELAEESGMTRCRLSPCGHILIDSEEDSGICVFLFFGFSNRKHFHDTHEGTLKWVAIKEVRKIKCVPDLPILISKVLNAASTGRQVYGKYQSSADNKMRIVIQLL